MSQVLCLIQYICFQKTSGSTVGAPNLLLALVRHLTSLRPCWLGLSALTRQCAFARIPPAKILKLSSISFILASLNTSAPAARFYGSEGQIKLLGGKSFCFYYMFKTKLLGTPFEVSSRVVCGTHLRLWQHRGWTVFRVFDVTRPGIDPSPCHRRRRVLNQLQPVLC